MTSDKRAHGRVDDLDERLRRLKAEVEPPPSPTPQGGLGMAFEVSGHLVAGLLVGGGIGYLLDQWLGTAPWLLIVFFFMGAGAGMINVYRTVSGIGMAMGYGPPSKRQGAGDTGDAAVRGDKTVKKKTED